MKDRYVYLHIEPTVNAITVHVKLDDEGVVVDAWQDDEVIAGTWKTYEEMGVVVKKAPKQVELPDGTIIEDCLGLHHDD